MQEMMIRVHLKGNGCTRMVTMFEIYIESRDQFTYNAVTWYIGKKTELTSAVAAIVNARDPSPKVLNMARGYGVLAAYGVWYACEESSEAYCTDSKPEPWRRVILKGENDGIIHAFIKEALIAYKECIALLRANDGITIYSWDDHDGWGSVGDAPRRQIDSLLLPQNIGDKLLHDLKTFVSPSTYEQYTRLNLPMIKIIMLHGTPGSGKTSLVRCLASELGLNIANYAGDDVQTFSDALVQAPAKTIVSVEDIDCILGTQGNQREKRGFAQLLNALDAVSRKDPLIVCFTTNFPGSLDIAVRRRVDHCIEFRHALKNQCVQLITRFFPESSDAAEKLWSTLTNDGCRAITMAMLQKFLVRSMKYDSPWDLLKDDPDAFTALFDVASNTSRSQHMYM